MDRSRKVSVTQARAARMSARTDALRIGRLAGRVMLAGVLAVPGPLNRIDGWEVPPS